MIGLGTIINTAAIILGGIAGGLFGKRLTERYQDTLMKACGLCVIFLGIAGALEKMFTVQNGSIVSGGTMMMIAFVLFLFARLRARSELFHKKKVAKG